MSTAAFAFLWSRYGATVQTALMAIYTTIFLLVLVTDLEHRLIFNVVIFPAKTATYGLDLATGAETTIADSTTGFTGYRPSWSPDGLRLYYLEVRGDAGAEAVLGLFQRLLRRDRAWLLLRGRLRPARAPLRLPVPATRAPTR